ncbi:hypothetical protein D3C72_2083650 [compost metagenome]
MVADDMVNAMANSGTNRPYFKMAAFLDLGLCNIKILFLMSDLLKKLFVKVFTDTPKVVLSSNKAYCSLSP